MAQTTQMQLQADPALDEISQISQISPEAKKSAETTAPKLPRVDSASPSARLSDIETNMANLQEVLGAVSDSIDKVEQQQLSSLRAVSQEVSMGLDRVKHELREGFRQDLSEALRGLLRPREEPLPVRLARLVRHSDSDALIPLWTVLAHLEQEDPLLEIQDVAEFLEEQGFELVKEFEGAPCDDEERWAVTGIDMVQK
jgi:hypothetical protein